MRKSFSKSFIGLCWVLCSPVFGQPVQTRTVTPQLMDFYLLNCDLMRADQGLQIGQEKAEGWDACVVSDLKKHEKEAREQGFVLINPKTAALYRPFGDVKNPMTLVFSRDRSDRFIKEALEDRRFVDFEEGVFRGNAHWIKRFIGASLKVNTRLTAPNRLLVEMENETSFPFSLAFGQTDGLSADVSELDLEPFSKVSFFLTGTAVSQPTVGLRVVANNAFTESGAPPEYMLSLKGTPYAHQALPARRLNLIPEPLEVKEGVGEFVLSDRTVILQNSPKAAAVIPFLIERVSAVTPIDLKVARKARSSEACVVFTEANDPSLGKEGYRIEVEPNKIEVKANETNGFFYAIQTLFQLMPPQIYSKAAERIQGVTWSLPVVSIRDVPRFGYRGMHLDVGRHMYPVEFIKKYIDLLAMQKMNVFHWHLTEDQGWRMEVKKYPELTKVGSKRARTISNRYQYQGNWTFDDQPYEGYYTQQEIREVVAYAKARCVQVIPEIDLPGHMLAALATYPHLGCTGGPYQVGDRWGIYDDVLCAGNESIYPFIENILKEVFELFPSEYVHIGGDECPKTRWKQCPKCQAKIKAENLSDEKELQSYVIRRVEKFLNANGKKLIGWDEILEGGIAPNAALMSWRGVAGGITAAKSGHPVIMTPNTYVYLDHYQANPDTEPMGNGRIASLEWTYSYEPVPTELTDQEAANIIGVQANVWTEYMRTSDYVEYMAFPRAAAVAETAWSGASKKDWPDFLERMQMQFDRWRFYGVNYAPHYKR